MKAPYWVLWVGPLAFTWVALVANLPSCNSTTAGREITFTAAVTGGISDDTLPTSEFSTYAGWSVTLDKAFAVVGPMYFYEGAPQASLFRRLLTVRDAYACPTHAQYNKGTVLGEVLEQHVVDLLGAPTDLGELMGVAGTCRTVELHFHPPGELTVAPSETSQKVLNGSTIRLEGLAVRDEATIPFVAELTLPDEGLMRIVESIAADVELDDVGSRPGTLVVEPLLDMWLATVEFDSLTEMNSERYIFSEDTQAWTALVRGVRSRDSYRVSWSTQ